MTRLAEAQPTGLVLTLAKGPGILERLRRHLARIEIAWTGQARRADLDPATMRDSGLTPDDLTGAPSHDPTLPFFMQAGFGRHGR
jgi:hypothetical protein